MKNFRQMRQRSLWPCEIVIRSKCVWKPCFMIFIGISLLIFAYGILRPVEKRFPEIQQEFTHEALGKVEPSMKDDIKSDQVKRLPVQKRVEVFKKSKPSFTWCPNGNQDNVDCKGLFLGDGNSLEKFCDWKPSCEINDGQIEKYSQHCSKFHQHFPFEFNYQFSAESQKYPLAFVIVVDKNAEQVVRLMQSIYRPQNVYCITYDPNSRMEFKRTIQNIVSCYSNILTPDDLQSKNFGRLSTLEANIQCLKILYRHPVPWNYVQMVSGNDFPLKTNEEMVEIFKMLNGSQDSDLKASEPYRYVNYYQENQADLAKETMTKSVPPGNMNIYKGNSAVSLSRKFVDFVLNDKIALQFFNYSKTMLLPEEQYWATLIHNLHIHPPGGYPGICSEYYRADKQWNKWWISRYQMRKELGNTCRGQWIHKTCVFGAGDLRELKPRPELMAHTIDSDFQPVTIYCLAQLQYNRTFLGRSYDDIIDYRFYEDLPAVRFHRLIDKSTYNCT